MPEFCPPYTCSANGKLIWSHVVGVGGSAEMKSRSNTGYVGLWCSAFGACGVAAEVWQREWVQIPSNGTTIHVDTEIRWTGGVATAGFGSFAGSKAWWRVDSGQRVETDIDPALGWDDIGQKLRAMAALASGQPLKMVVIWLGEIQRYQELRQALESQSRRTTRLTFSRTVNAGTHCINVGLRANLSSVLTGSSQAILVGEVPRITVTW